MSSSTRLVQMFKRDELFAISMEDIFLVQPVVLSAGGALR